MQLNFYMFIISTNLRGDLTPIIFTHTQPLFIFLYNSISLLSPLTQSSNFIIEQTLHWSLIQLSIASHSVRSLHSSHINNNNNKKLLTVILKNIEGAEEEGRSIKGRICRFRVYPSEDCSSWLFIISNKSYKIRSNPLPRRWDPCSSHQSVLIMLLSCRLKLEESKP